MLPITGSEDPRDAYYYPYDDAMCGYVLAPAAPLIPARLPHPTGSTRTPSP